MSTKRHLPKGRRKSVLHLDLKNVKLCRFFCKRKKIRNLCVHIHDLDNNDVIPTLRRHLSMHKSLTTKALDERSIEKK